MDQLKYIITVKPNRGRADYLFDALTSLNQLYENLKRRKTLSSNEVRIIETMIQLRL